MSYINWWLRKQLNKRAVEEIHERIWELNKSLMQPNPEYPHGHPHTNGMVDGLRFALNAIETEYK